MGSSRSLVRTCAVVAALGVGTSACAGSDDATGGRPVTGAEASAASTTVAAPPTSATVPAAAATVASALPKVDVVDLATGGTVRLSELPTAGKPMLLWMWAPY